MAAWLPVAEEEETEDAYIVRAELPGIPAENVDIELEGDELSISGEMSEEKRGKVLSRRTGKSPTAPACRAVRTPRISTPT
ncbi:Hsp20/alpha crystallin family protein [Streptomyces sp. NPDC052236]|uniref:Hsp20/alpha crystallin family protein n=1 Tax=Streptomyces sp. NPDC052236 TaxID=3365686 RepID=UPI0037D269FA